MDTSTAHPVLLWPLIVYFLAVIFLVAALGYLWRLGALDWGTMVRTAHRR